MVLRGLTIAQKSLKEHLEVIGHKEAFDEYYVKHMISAMVELFARYINQRLDFYLSILDK